jgi:HlyD family secretion protein
METGNKENILCVKESLLQFNRITDKPFVEIKQEDGSYKSKNVEIGISDGINVEILEGVTENDKIKVWNIITDDSDIDDDERGEIDD